MFCYMLKAMQMFFFLNLVELWLVFGCPYKSIDIRVRCISLMTALYVRESGV